MLMIARFFATLFCDRKAATAVEYGLVLTLITIAVIASIRGVAGANQNMYGKIESSYRTAAGQ